MEKELQKEQIVQTFRVRQARQYLGIAVTLLLLLFFVLVHKRPDIFGQVARSVIFAAQVFCIVAFVVFSSLNWRCPACSKYLGNDIGRPFCRKCGVRFK